MWRILCVFLLSAVCIPGCGSVESGKQPVSATGVSLHVEGMMCAESCAKSVEEILAAQPGVHQVAVDFEHKQATCQVDPQTFDVDAAVAELADQDFTASIEQ